MAKAHGGISTMGTVGAFLNRRACSDTLFHVLSDAFDHPLLPEERAAMPLAGGIMQHGYQCGMIWGAALAAGAEAYRRFGPGPQAEAKAIIAARRIVESFRTLNQHTNCLEITDIDKSSSTMQMITYFLIKGGTIHCFRMAARYAPVAYNEINAALSEESAEVPSPPVSCAAVLAQKLGESDLHSVMAAGLAGGIGLSGGACGALGAAIWILAMRSNQERGGKIDYKDPKGLDAIERFIKCSGFQFECSEIVGRRFANVSDHAAYVRDGGCSKIIEVLATQ